ncbi:hypothetical protein H5T58_02165, partial [Candidatus Parcubacteria bacterium]|nr:hypothetical protein [Candidatus Parcubacteria bacterium]
MQKKFLKISIFIFFFLFLPVFSFADSYLEKRIFFVDKAFDDFKRDRVLATNFIVGDRLYIYVEDEVWQNFSIAKREEMVSFFKNLSLDF